MGGSPPAVGGGGTSVPGKAGGPSCPTGTGVAPLVGSFLGSFPTHPVRSKNTNNPEIPKRDRKAVMVYLECRWFKRFVHQPGGRVVSTGAKSLFLLGVMSTIRFVPLVELLAQCHRRQK